MTSLAIDLPADGRKRQRQNNESNADSEGNEPNKKFKCEPCNRSFTEHKSLLRHQRENKKHRHSNLATRDNYRCDMCQNIFARAHDLKRHRKEQHLGGKIACSECGKLTRANIPHKGSTGAQCSGRRDGAAPNGTLASNEASTDLARPQGIPEATCDSVMDSLTQQLSKASTGKTAVMDMATYKKQVRTRTNRRLVPCGICHLDFEINNCDTLLQHLQNHFESLNGRYNCTICDISFVHEADLKRHESSAAAGDCGFNFLHKAPCPGHHRPLRDDCTPAPGPCRSDDDRFNFTYRVRAWEQVQLNTFVSNLQPLVELKLEQEQGDGATIWTQTMIRDRHPAHERAACDVKSVGSRLMLSTTYANNSCRVDLEVAAERRRKRGSIHSHSQLVGNSFRSTSRGADDAGPHTTAESLPIKVPKKREHRLKKLMVWNGNKIPSTIRSRKHESTSTTALSPFNHEADILADINHPRWPTMATPNETLPTEMNELDGESYTDRCEAQEETNICEQLGFNEFLHQMLCEAASDGDVDTVAFAISCGADVNALDNFQRHALHLAVFAGHTNVVSLLLEAGADVNICDLSSKPPLMSAVTLFWDYGADPDEECSTGDDVLSMSIFKKQFAIARLVIDYGAPVLVFHVVSAIKRRADSSFLEMLIEKCKDFKSPSCGHTALASAVSASRMDIVHMLVERGAEINPPSLSAKQYAIVRAAESGCTEIMNYLIRHGAKLDLPTEEQTVGNGALHRAARRGHPGIIRLLLQHGIQVNNGTLKLDRFRTRHTMLCDAARHGNLECVQILLQNGVGLDARCGVGHTALLEAAEWYRDEVVQYLLSQGADVNVQDKDGHTPLCRNLYWSRPTGPATFRRLLEAGANPDGCISCAVKVEKYIERLCGTSCGYLRY